MSRSRASRRRFLVASVIGIAGVVTWCRNAISGGQQHARFVAEARRMKAIALAAGDQPYGAIVVKDGRIVGYGPSRVIVDGNIDAHAERVALWDAQQRLGGPAVAGAVIYSTSPPCSICQRALAAAGIERMYHGNDATDGGRPRR